MLKNGEAIEKIVKWTGLSKEMDSSGVWRVETSPYEHALLTSKPDERDRITQLIAEKGDTLRGIEAWVKERE